MVGYVLISSASATCAALWGHKTLVRALPPDESADFRLAGRLAKWELSQLSDLRGPVGSFVRRFMAETDERERVDLVCERQAQVDLETTDVGRRLERLARCILAVGATLTVIAASRAAAAQDSAAGLGALFPLAVSVAAALYGRYSVRHTSDRIAERRRDWDRLSSFLLSRRAFEPAADPSDGQLDGASPKKSHLVGQRPSVSHGSPKHRQILKESPAAASAPGAPMLCLA